MKTRTTQGLILVLGCLASMLGCDDRPSDEPIAPGARTEALQQERPTTEEVRQPPMERADPTAERTAGQSATEAIAQSRCQREQRCENIGDGQKYSSMQECLSEVRSEWREDLSARECPEGINQPQLADCLDNIRSQDCNAPVDYLARIVECTAGQICQG